MILNINSIYTKILGIFILLAFIYYRFIYERLPRSLLLVYEEYSVIKVKYALLSIIILSFMLSIIICLFNYCVITKKPLTIKESFIVKFLMKFIIIIKDALFSIYKHIADNLENGYNKVRTICIYSYKIFAHKEKYIVIVDCIILCSICFSFLYDILSNFTLYYFYKSLMLLGINFLIKLWLYLIEDWVSNLSIVTENLNITHRFLPDGRDHFHFEVKPGFTFQEAELIMKHDKEEFLRMVPLKGFLDSYYEYEAFYKPRTLFIIYLLYTIGWSFVLYKNYIYFFLFN